MAWKWKGAPEYKNERLAYYQSLLHKQGITNSDHLRDLTAQIIQENGSLSETRHGDEGCSIGIIQYNACVHANLSARQYIERNPEWGDWRYQLERMADMVAERYDMYNGDIFRTVVHHNRPASAQANRDTPAGYWRDVQSRVSLLDK